MPVVGAPGVASSVASLTPLGLPFAYTQTNPAKIVAQPGNPPVGTLTDDFTTQDASKWVFGANATVSGGQLTLSTSATYAGITSVGRYTLLGSSASVQVVRAAAGGAGLVDTSLFLQIDASNNVGFTVEGGVLYAQYQIAGTYTTVAQAAYDAAAHACWRVSESGGVVTWWTSRDGSAWSSFGTWTAAGLSLTGLQFHLETGFYGATSSATAAVFDNVSLAAATVAGPTATAAAGAPAGTVTATRSSTSVAGPPASVTATAPAGVIQNWFTATLWNPADPWPGPDSNTSGSSATVMGTLAATAAAAPAGTVTATSNATISGPVSTVLSGATAGAVAAVRTVALVGVAAGAAVAAPVGGSVAGAAQVGGPVVTTAAMAPAGSVSVGTSRTTAPAGIAVAASAGSVTTTGSAAVVGAPATVVVVAPAGAVTLGGSIAFAGPTAGVTTSAPPGAVASSSTAAVSGAPASVTVAALAGSVAVTTSAQIIGLAASAQARALAGLVATSVALVSPPAGIVIGAPAGSVHGGSAFRDITLTVVSLTARTLAGSVTARTTTATVRTRTTTGTIRGRTSGASTAARTLTGTLEA